MYMDNQELSEVTNKDTYVPLDFTDWEQLHASIAPPQPFQKADSYLQEQIKEPTEREDCESGFDEPSSLSTTPF